MLCFIHILTKEVNSLILILPFPEIQDYVFHPRSQILITKREFEKEYIRSQILITKREFEKEYIRPECYALFIQYQVASIITKFN
jgi:hypothetical protein